MVIKLILGKTWQFSYFFLYPVGLGGMLKEPNVEAITVTCSPNIHNGYPGWTVFPEVTNQNIECYRF